MNDDTRALFTKSLESRPALARKPVTWKSLAHVIDKLTDALFTIQKGQREKREALEQRVKELEVSQLVFKGTFDETRVYASVDTQNRQLVDTSEPTIN